MIHKILIPSDGSELADHAVKSGIELARATRACVVGLAVTEPYPLNMYGELMFSGFDSLLHFHDEGQEFAERALAPMEKAAKAAGISYRSSTVFSRSPADAIVSAAEREGCDLICMATEERRDLLGPHLSREAIWILTHTRVPVLICH
jgi:nucleotide-binding universal stress UspA family protein